MKEIFEENWSCLQCGQCKYFKVDADRATSTCKRLDHKHIKFAKPWFKSYDCGQFNSMVCDEFYPRDSCRWLKEHWISWEDYWDGEEPKPTETIPLVLDGDFSVRYKVLKSDFITGNFLDDSGNLKWVEKEYYKRSKSSPIGYKLIHEYRKDGI